MKKVKPFFTIILISLMFAILLPSAAYGAEPAANGYIHVDSDIYYVPGYKGLQVQGTFPAKYDPRKEAWFQSIQVKDQGLTEICYACTVTTAAEISYAKETKQPVSPMSPTQFAWFFYNRVNDPLGNTGGDKNINESGYPWYQMGGASLYSMYHMASRSGLIKDELAPLKEIAENISQVPDPYLSAEYAYDHDAIILENCEYHDGLPYTADGINSLKRLIRDYGAAVTAIQVHGNNDSGWVSFKDGNPVNAPFYNPDFDREKGDSCNHAVVVVGWDDNYSKENFGSYNVKDGTYNAQPEKDGAWIVQSSWGEMYGDNGYYYISYESKDILSNWLICLDMEAAETSPYLFQYDGSSYSGYVDMKKGEGCANVFHAPEDQQILIDRVSFFTANEGKTDYVVDIYTGLTDPGNPTSGLKAMPSQAVSTDVPGYKTVKLKEAVTVDPGESWSVVFTAKSPVRFSTETSYNTGLGINSYREPSCRELSYREPWGNSQNKRHPDGKDERQREDRTDPLLEQNQCSCRLRYLYLQM